MRLRNLSIGAAAGLVLIGALVTNAPPAPLAVASPSTDSQTQAGMSLAEQGSTSSPDLDAAGENGEARAQLLELAGTQSKQEIDEIWNSGRPASGLIDEQGNVVAAFYN